MRILKCVKYIYLLKWEEFREEDKEPVFFCPVGYILWEWFLDMALLVHRLFHLHLPPVSSAHSCDKPQSLFCNWAASKSPPVLLTVSKSAISCMANSRRVKMVAKQIQRELSDMLLTDKVLQYAVLPEASLGADRYLSSLTTISDVEVSSDLQVGLHLMINPLILISLHFFLSWAKILTLLFGYNLELSNKT